MTKPKLAIGGGINGEMVSNISHNTRLDLLFEEIKKRGIELDADILQCEMGVQSCYRPQQLASVAFRSPAMLLVISGRKELEFGNRVFVANPGEMLLVPGDVEGWMSKSPSNRSGIYQGLGIRFDLDTIEAFQKNYGSSLDSWDISPKWSVKAPDSLIEWLINWLNWTRKYPTAKQVQRHRLIELLLLLAQNGLAGNILLSRNPSWRQRVSELIRVDPAREWRTQDVCNRFGLSESSLRRKLQIEETSFRTILEETRLMSGLSYIQETDWSVGRIADAVGYRSQSRFTARFKKRFDVTPSELKRSRTVDGGELQAVTGD